MGAPPASRAGQLEIIALFPFDNPVFCRLPAWSAKRIDGVDAPAFLHGQFTNDVTGLAVAATQWNAWCSPKGRVLATFALKRTAADAFILVLPADVAAGVVKRLRMFVMRSKVTVTPLGDTHRVIGASAGFAMPALAGAAVDFESLDVPDGRRIIVCGTESVALVDEALAESAIAMQPVAWDQMAIHAGIPYVTAATQDQFVPQMLNWELVGGVNFQKGCYPGQEIVARMQYLGRLKERLYRAHVIVHRVADGIPASGTSLYSAGFGIQACGTVVNAAAAARGEGFDMLAVIKVDSAEREPVRIAIDPDAAVIHIEQLPYPVPDRPRPNAAA